MITLCFTSFVLHLGITTHLQYKKNVKQNTREEQRDQTIEIGTSNMHPSITQKAHKKNLTINF